MNPDLHTAGATVPAPLGAVVPKVAVVVHVYYPELWPEIAARLRALSHPFDLWITTTTDRQESVTAQVRADFAEARIHARPNAGMDVLPLLHLVPELVRHGYVAVCKLHTKQGDGELAEVWRGVMLDALVGDDALFHQTAQAFASNPVLHLAGPASLYQSVRKLMLDNAPELERFWSLWTGLAWPQDGTFDWGFFAGTMFWVRPETLQPLATALLEHAGAWWEAGYQKDGQAVHAIERLLGYLPVWQRGQVGLIYEEALGGVLHTVAAPGPLGQAGVGDVMRQYRTLAQELPHWHSTGLLEAPHYLAQCPELAGTPVDLAAHYLLIGRFQGRAPGPDFDAALYAPVLAAEPVDWMAEQQRLRTPGLVSVVVPVLNQPELTRACVVAVCQHTQQPFELLLVDNGSDATTQMVLQELADQHPQVRVLRQPHNCNFAWGCNLGFAASSGQHVVFLNNDTVVTPNWLPPLVQPLARPDVVAVQPRLLYPNGTVQSMGVVFAPDQPVGYALYAGLRPDERWAGRSRRLQAVTGACMAVRATDFAAVRGFDPVYLNGQEDIDLCLRLSRAHSGAGGWYAADSTVLHHESATPKRMQHIARNRAVFVRRWAGGVRADDVRHYALDGFDVAARPPEGGAPRLQPRPMPQVYPLHDLEPITGMAYGWRATGDDPYFGMDWPPYRQPRDGWHKLDVRIESASRKGCAKLYFDLGEGFNEAHAIPLPYDSNRPASRVFHLPVTPLAWRFDPLDKEGQLVLRDFNVTPLSQREAQEWMQQATGLWGSDVRLAALQAQYAELFDLKPGAMAYHDWIDQVEAPSLPTPEHAEAVMANLAHRPLISVVMPTYNTPEVYLRACIDSVLAQVYPHWELCIADDHSPDERVREVLREYAARDVRIRVVYRAENGHISRASNSALELAQGEFVALLDHDDALPPHALYFMALAMNQHPDAQILYSDEDKIDAKGQRSEPHFKSDWNPDLFYSQNYVSHLGVYRRDLLQRIGGFRTGVEGSQDQDLLLRCLPHVTASQVVHVPRVLYHWRALEGSTARAAGEKSYTTDAGLKALRDHFDTQGPAGTTVEAGLVPNTYHVCWPWPEPQPLVSLLIPTRDRKTITELAVRSILDKTTYPHYEILILDNGSVEPETLAWFADVQAEDARVKVLRYDHPFNYSAINNFGVQHARGSIVGLVNNDVEVISPDWLTEMVRHASRPDIGCVGAKLYYSNGKIQHAGVILGIGGVAGHAHKYFGRNQHGYFSRLKLVQNFSAVTAACLLVRRDVYEAAGGLDEDNLHVAFNDVDFCLKVRQAGYRNLWTPYAELYHHESISRGHEDTPEKQTRFNKEVAFMKNKWADQLLVDPFYNPHLTKDREDFSMGNS